MIVSFGFDKGGSKAIIWIMIRKMVKEVYLMQNKFCFKKISQGLVLELVKLFSKFTLQKINKMLSGRDYSASMLTG